MCGALPPTLEKHIRCTPGDSRSIFLRPAGCIWIPLGALSRTVRPIRFHFPECDFWSVFSGPAGCIWTPSGTILMTRGRILTPVPSILVAFWSSGPGLRSQWGTLAHFLEKGAKKVTNGRPTGAPNGTFFGTFSIFLSFGGCYCGSLAETGFWVFFLRCFVGVRKAEYGFDHSFYCAKRTSHIWKQDRIF